MLPKTRQKSKLFLGAVSGQGEREPNEKALPNRSTLMTAGKK